MVTKALKDDRACTCGLVMMEVLRGARNAKERKILIEHFSILEYLELVQQDYFQAAQTASLLKQKGFTLKTLDLLIAHLAVKHRLILLHDDSDYEWMALHIPLKAMNPKSQ